MLQHFFFAHCPRTHSTDQPIYDLVLVSYQLWLKRGVNIIQQSTTVVVMIMMMMMVPDPGNIKSLYLFSPLSLLYLGPLSRTNR